MPTCQTPSPKVVFGPLGVGFGVGLAGLVGVGVGFGVGVGVGVSAVVAIGVGALVAVDAAAMVVVLTAVDWAVLLVVVLTVFADVDPQATKITTNKPIRPARTRDRTHRITEPPLDDRPNVAVATRAVKAVNDARATLWINEVLPSTSMMAQTSMGDMRRCGELGRRHFPLKRG